MTIHHARACPQAASVLPPAIRAGIAGYPAIPATRARRLLGQVRWDAPLEADSALTDDGFPFELAVTTADDSLRMTLDPFAHLPPAARLAPTCALAQSLGAPLTDPRISTLADQPARIGAWLGLRLDKAGALTSKLYADWSPQAPALGALTLPDRLPCGQRAQPRMIGLGPVTAQSEIYYRFPAATLRTLGHVLDHAGLGARKPDLARLLGPHIRPRLNIGASLAGDATRVTAVTFYVFARALWGLDPSCRAAMTAHLSAAGRDPRAYTQATRALQRHRGAHGLAALTFTAKATAWGTGLRPVALPRAAHHTAR